ncbi:MAG: DsrE family protein [Oligoflexia bacterium]|nr:DsrE family protein [Oligoflexia bacterium]
MKEVIVLKSNVMGDGPSELGELLLQNFLSTFHYLHSLLETSKQETSEKLSTSTIILYNTAVLIALKHEEEEKNKFYEILEKLHSKGVEIILCATCVKYFDLENKILVGRISNMREIVEKMRSANKLITP